MAQCGQKRTGGGVDFYCTLWMTPNEMCATHDVRKIHVVHDAMSPLDGRQTSDSELNRRGAIHELQQPITPARTHTHSADGCQPTGVSRSCYDTVAASSDVDHSALQLR